jgi:hypothetical protein
MSVAYVLIRGTVGTLYTAGDRRFDGFEQL